MLHPDSGDEHLERAATRTRAHLARARHDATTDEQTECPHLSSRQTSRYLLPLTPLRPRDAVAEAIVRRG
jgi:hypothetical protein